MVALLPRQVSASPSQWNIAATPEEMTPELDESGGMRVDLSFQAIAQQAASLLEIKVGL
jgi:hypothetical protein